MTYTSRLACLAILLTWPVLTFTKDPDYTIQQLNIPVGITWGEPAAINERGQIVGLLCCHDLGSGLPAPQFAVMWNNGNVIELPSPPGPSGDLTLASDINNGGQVVGSRGIIRGLLWAGNSTPIELGPLPGYCCADARSINERGQIVGRSTTSSGPPSPSTATLWGKDGAMVNVGMLPGDSSSLAVAINNSGQVVGWSQTSATTRAFLWDKGTMSELPGLAGQQATIVKDINDRGQAVGYSGPSPVMWEHRTLIRLDTLPPLTSGQALGINNNGQIVGFLQSPTSSARVPVLWDNGKAMELPMLPPVPGVLNDYAATAINNGGTIVGTDRRGAPHPLVWVRNARSGD